MVGECLSAGGNRLTRMVGYVFNLKPGWLHGRKIGLQPNDMGSRSVLATIHCKTLDPYQLKDTPKQIHATYWDL